MSDKKLMCLDASESSLLSMTPFLLYGLSCSNIFTLFCIMRSSSQGLLHRRSSWSSLPQLKHLLSFLDGPFRKNFLKLKDTHAKPHGRHDAERVQRRGQPNKSTTENPCVSDEYLLAIAIKFVNNTVEPEEIFLFLLVFGSLPKLSLPSSSPAAVP